MNTIYLVNDKPLTWIELIELSWKYGYSEDDGLYLTSKASQILRDCGFTVKEKP